jgi:predicted DNA-binding protein
MEKTVMIGVRVSPEMREKLQAIADKEERTLSQVCMRILRDHLRDLEKSDKPNLPPKKKGKPEPE